MACVNVSELRCPLTGNVQPRKDTFETVTKCGTGFTDKDLATLHEMLQKHLVPTQKQPSPIHLKGRRMV